MKKRGETKEKKSIDENRTTKSSLETDKSIMRDDSDPEDADEDDADEDADADVLEEAPSTSALEEEEDDATINAGLHNVSNTCYLNATVQV